MRLFPKSDKLEHVCYDIRGPVHKEALRLEEEGNKILKLNIGNPAPFGFEAPDEILVDVLRNLPSAQGYCDSKGLYSARKAIVQYYQSKGFSARPSMMCILVTAYQSLSQWQCKHCSMMAMKCLCRCLIIRFGLLR